MTESQLTRLSRKNLLKLVKSARRQHYKPADILDFIKHQLASTDRDVCRLGRENAIWFLHQYARDRTRKGGL